MCAHGAFVEKFIVAWGISAANDNADISRLLAEWAFAQIGRLNFHAPSVRRERWSVSQSPMPLVVIGDGPQHIKRHKVPNEASDLFKDGTTGYGNGPAKWCKGGLRCAHPHCELRLERRGDRIGDELRLLSGHGLGTFRTVKASEPRLSNNLRLHPESEQHGHGPALPAIAGRGCGGLCRGGQRRHIVRMPLKFLIREQVFFG